MNKNFTKKLIAILILSILVPAVSLAATVPFVLTKAPTTITSDAAILEAKVVQDGGDDDIDVWFQYGLTDSLGSKSSVKTNNGKGVFSIRITGLKECTKYFYRPSAENSAGIAYGHIDQLVTYCPLADGTNSTDTSGVATDVNTGIAVDILGSILLPLAIAIALVWILRSPLVGFDKWAHNKKRSARAHRAHKKLEKITKK